MVNLTNLKGFEAYATEIGYLYDSIGKNLKKWVKVKTVNSKNQKIYILNLQLWKK